MYNDLIHANMLTALRHWKNENWDRMQDLDNRDIYMATLIAVYIRSSAYPATFECELSLLGIRHKNSRLMLFLFQGPHIFSLLIGYF